MITATEAEEDSWTATYLFQDVARAVVRLRKNRAGRKLIGNLVTALLNGSEDDIFKALLVLEANEMADLIEAQPRPR